MESQLECLCCGSTSRGFALRCKCESQIKKACKECEKCPDHCRCVERRQKAEELKALCEIRDWAAKQPCEKPTHVKYRDARGGDYHANCGQCTPCMARKMIGQEDDS